MLGVVRDLLVCGAVYTIQKQQCMPAAQSAVEVLVLRGPFQVTLNPNNKRWNGVKRRLKYSFPALIVSMDKQYEGGIFIQCMDQSRNKLQVEALKGTKRRHRVFRPSLVKAHCLP